MKHKRIAFNMSVLAEQVISLVQKMATSIKSPSKYKFILSAQNKT